MTLRADARGPFKRADGVWYYVLPSGKKVEERSLPHDLRPWRPFEQTQPMMEGEPIELPEGDEFWANSHYLVVKRVIGASSMGLGAVHLSIRTVENDHRHDWREFQRIKNELCGEHWEAVELYPDVDRLVDSANQFHLWCISEQYPIGFPSRFVHDTGVAESTGGSQRPFAAIACDQCGKPVDTTGTVCGSCALKLLGMA